jgi:diacylglycerol kinase (ATP)
MPADPSKMKPRAGRASAAKALNSGKRRRLLLVSNPNSRRGSASVDPAIETLAAAGIDVTPVAAKSASGLTSAILAEAEGADGIIVAGGDGTMNAAAEALVKTGLPLGMLPSGTANDLARTLAIPIDPRKASEIIAAGHTRRIDIGSVNGHYFFNVASIGLAADLAGRLTKEGKRRFGRLSYAVAAFKVLLEARPFTADIINKGEVTRVKTLQIGIGNGRFYGGGMTVESSALINDGHLDLYSLEIDEVWKLALLLRKFRLGQHGLWEEVRTARCTEFEVRTRRPQPINLDGELKTQTPARFEIHPKAVTVFAPMAEPGIAPAPGLTPAKITPSARLP